MEFVEFLSTGLGFGLVLRFVAQGVGAVWALLGAMIRAV
jgi:hypothetical protein